MLQTIREKSQGWIATVILGFICFTFALWGIHYYLTSSSATTVVAKVNGVKISEQVFNQSLRQLQQQEEMNLGGNYSNDEAFQSQLKAQVLNQLIDQQILLQALAKQGFYVGQDQVEQIIAQIPIFQLNGKFSATRFQQALNAMQYSPEMFMQTLGQQIMASQLNKGLVESSFSLPDDVKNAVHLMRQTRDVGYTVIKASNVKSVADITDKEMQAFYAAHKQVFTVPEKAKLSYIMLSVDDLKNRQKISDKAINAYYQANIAQFTKPKKQTVAEAKSQITNILKMQAAEKAFATASDNLANLTYESPTSLKSASQELDLPINTSDEISKGELGNGILANPKVIRAAFSNDVFSEGYNSDLIELSPTQQVVIRIKEKMPAKLLPFDKVKPQIMAILEKEHQMQAAKQLADKVANALASGQNGVKVVKQYGLSWHEHTDVDRHQQNVDPKILLQVFQMQKPHDREHPTTAVFKLPSGGYAAVALYEVVPGKLSSLTDTEKQAFSEVIGKKYGNVDYQLFMNSMKNKANVKQYMKLADIQQD